ncbi:hypothetical protein L2E82_40185 [Cichorium intybus]|uniref:Uncharacterized protein n=1 Tax=Cichorium intybus TaxID=13427 RepID=A0ACB9AKD5_CICIN|nr:hypothetical protein L2E82_40185 [Cichorium intybus]
MVETDADHGVDTTASSKDRIDRFCFIITVLRRLLHQRRRVFDIRTGVTYSAKERRRNDEDGGGGIRPEKMEEAEGEPENEMVTGGNRSRRSRWYQIGEAESVGVEPIAVDREQRRGGRLVAAVNEISMEAIV